MTGHLTIDWEAARHPVAGVVRVGATPPQAFTGWLELLAVLQRTLAAAPDHNQSTTPKETP